MSGTSTQSSSFLKRAWKLEEFVAHGSNVNCLSLGHKSGRVLATGGDDKKVNLWAVGKPNCILSLSGHSTAVECVRFGGSEELVCAGSLSGALKIWDLEATKIVRTLTGHKGNIRSIDFHPYGDFISTGSLDTNIKLWDIRRKGCIFTYKGHNLSVNSLKFSPDGQWIASAGEDCAVKLWDLRAGKMLAEFISHSGPVTDVEFHPHEFLLASASQDRSVNFWDLEKFSIVSTTDSDTGPVRTISFHPTGECIYAGATDVLKVYGWEPSRCFDTVAMGWGRIIDIAIAQNQLIGAAFHGIYVSLYVIDLARVQPFGGPSQESFKHGVSLRKSFIKDQMEGKAGLESMKTEETSDTGGDDTMVEDELALKIDNLTDFHDIFGKKRELQRTPPPIGSSGSDKTSAGDASNLNNNGGQSVLLLRPEARKSIPQKSSPPHLNQYSVTTSSPDHSRRGSGTCSKNVNRFDNTTSISLQTMSGVQSTDLRRGSTNDLSRSPQKENPGCSPSMHRSRALSESRKEPHCNNNVVEDQKYLVRTSPPEFVLLRQSSSPGSPHLSTSSHLSHPLGQSNVHRQSVPNLTSSHLSSSKINYSTLDLPSKLKSNKSQQQETVISFLGTPKNSREAQDYNYKPEKLAADSAFLNRTIGGLNIEDFMPKQFDGLSVGGLNISNELGGIRSMEMSEQEVLSSICRGHSDLTSVLLSRIRGLQVAYRTWLTKDLRTAIEHLLDTSNQALLVDFLSILNLRPSMWNLDVLTLLLPSVNLLMQSKYEAYVVCGTDTLKLMIKNFAPMIKSNMAGPIHSVGVDISREERYNKCLECYNHLMSIRAFLFKRQTVPGKLGHTFRELVILMQAFD